MVLRNPLQSLIFSVTSATLEWVEIDRNAPIVLPQCYPGWGAEKSFMADTVNFTKAMLDALALPKTGKRHEYRDAKQAALRLRVTASGVKTFCVFKRVKGGGMERVTLGRYPEMTIDQARRKAAEIVGKIAEGDNPAEVRRAIRAEMTFRELFAEFRERHGKKLLSWKADEQRYRDYLDPSLGKRRLSEITTAMISRILSDVEKRGKANATINNVRALASSIFARGMEWGLVGTNPVSATKTRKKVSRDRFLQSDELPRFFEALMEEPNDTVRCYFLMSLLTGARRSNVLAMRWREINVDARIWRIGKTKNGEPQNVTLSEPALALLAQMRESAEKGADYVFPGEGASGHLVEPKKGWKRILDRDELAQLLIMIEGAGGSLDPKRSARTGEEVYESLDARLERAREVASGLGLKVEDVRLGDLKIHDLRRTLGSWQAMTGASLLIIGKSLNHKSPQATAIYARLDLDPVRAAVDKATAAMFSAAGIQSVDAASGV